MLLGNYPEGLCRDGDDQMIDQMMGSERIAHVDWVFESCVFGSLLSSSGVERGVTG